MLFVAVFANKESEMQSNKSPDVMRYVLSIAVVAALTFLSGWVLLPFMAAGVWSVLIVVATWPLLIALQKALGGRRALAALMMTLGILFLLILPLFLLISTTIQHSDALVQMGKGLTGRSLPLAPVWLNDVALVGAPLAQLWNGIAASGTADLLKEYALPHLSQAGHWVIGSLSGVGGLVLQFVLMTLISAVIYLQGEKAAVLARQFGRRLGGERGESAILLTAQAIRSVALGVGVTALLQTLLGTIGLALAGIPYAMLLGGVMLLLCIAQVGPSLVMVPAVIWMFWQGESTGWTIFLAVWSLIVITMDNFLRPWLIRRGADLPLMLILIGVIGGLLTFGLIGIFVGPVVLAVTYTLLVAWLNESIETQAPVSDQEQGR
jgi:predicted PurR-regulated permease PerM